MTIKQKIWSIPLITILIFAIGMAITYKASSYTYDLLQRTGIIHYPYLHNIQTLSENLNAIQESFLDALDTNGGYGINRARHKAEDFRKAAEEIAILDGKKDISQEILTQFNNYFAAADSAASIMIGVKKGEVAPDLNRMIAALNKLKNTLKEENATANASFGESLELSKSNVQKMLLVSLISVAFVVVGLAYISYRLITSILLSLEYLRMGAKRIAQGDFTARIPERGKDELTMVIQSFNSMGEELQIATEKRIQYQKQLETLNLELEDRVTTRTAQLGVALEEANKANAAVAYMADHDTLTGLLNRRRFQEELDLWGKYALRYKRPMALMFIDLDKFKHINDTYGHLGGDEYLVAFTAILKTVLRSTDYISRWGGDEFAALLTETNAAAACEVASKLNKVFSTTPITVVGKTLHVSASIGIAILPEHTSDITELTAFADAAMYQAKDAGRGCFYLYSASAHEVQHMDQYAHWAGRIRRALETDQFILFYQPLLNLKTRATPEYEALLRMEDTDGQFISPGVFLASAERFDLSIAIDRMVIRKTAHKIATLKKQNIHLCLSLNLSPQSLEDASIINYIRDALREFDIAPENLALEISETSILQNISRVLNLSSEIMQLGCRLILDDIGVGFSSFHYLAPLSIHSIKIHGDLIHNLQLESNRDYLTGLCKTCHELNIQVVAKFVEDFSLLDPLRAIGVDYAQGFAIGTPLESMDTF
ncbi:MAG: EAL domain-containing protein [Gallionellaceae bacterium]|nr:EAL domain-containing protein [Gallionellaceae bacterium]